MQDPIIKFLIDEAALTPWVEKVILFGSRARGDAHERSDYDIAVVVTHDDHWFEWADMIREKAPTLCGIDLIKLDKHTSASLRQVIQEEGKIIYE